MQLTLPSIILLKVIDQRPAILTQIPTVHRLPALLQKQQPIEDLEELAARLMDRARNSLVVVCKVAQEARDGPCTLGVKTGSGLVEEEKQLGLRSKFDADGSCSFLG